MMISMVKQAYIVCPLCGWNRVIESERRSEKGKRSKYEWPRVNLKTAYMLQIREGGGKKAGSGAKGRGKAPGSGFHLVPSESLNLSEMLDNPLYVDFLGEIKAQFLTVVKDAVALGWIKPKELRFKKEVE